MRIQLISEIQIKDGNLIYVGAMSPVLATQIFEKHIQKEGFINQRDFCTHILRIRWDSELMMNENEGLPTKPEMTGYDNLILIYQFVNERLLIVFQDQGVHSIPVCAAFESDGPKSIMFTPIYEEYKTKYCECPDETDWYEVYEAAFKFPRIDKTKLRDSLTQKS